jgi:hypothetical protein
VTRKFLHGYSSWLDNQSKRLFATPEVGCDWLFGAVSD